jgi:hypothetical protein
VRHPTSGEWPLCAGSALMQPAMRFVLRIDQATGLHSGVGLKKVKQ